MPSESIRIIYNTDTCVLGESIIFESVAGTPNNVLFNGRDIPVLEDGVQIADINVVWSTSKGAYDFYYEYTPQSIGEHLIQIGTFSAMTNLKVTITVTEPPALTGSWTINNKTVQSLHIGQKEIQSIERVSDGAIIYQRHTYNLTVQLSSNTIYTDGSTVISGVLTDNGSAMANETITIYDGNTSLGTYTTDNNGAYSKTLSGLSIGTHSIKAKWSTTYSSVISLEIKQYPLILDWGTNSGKEVQGYRSGDGLIGSNMVIDWGDGTTQTLSSNTPLPSHIYSSNGNKTITVTGIITGIGDYGLRSNKGRLKSINIPQGITSIGNQGISSSDITSLNIPLGVTNIGSRAFYTSANLTSVSIPSSVTSIGSECFKNCFRLVDYQLYWDNPPITWDSNLMPNNSGAYFTIPNGSTANYVAKSFPIAKLIERSA